MEDAAGPDAGREGVAADADAAAGQVCGGGDAAVPAHGDAAVVEGAGQKDGQGGEGLGVGAGAQVGGQGHFGHIKLQAAHHTAENGGYGRHFNLLHTEQVGCRRAVFQRRRVAVAADGGSQGQLAHAGVLL